MYVENIFYAVAAKENNSRHFDTSWKRVFDPFKATFLSRYNFRMSNQTV